ncbi:hypothetical protein [Helicobacter sp. MIT 05-5294]|nr:hypothetical protein [Helicobacter sp. MIT 05-5294]
MQQQKPQVQFSLASRFFNFCARFALRSKAQDLSVLEIFRKFDLGL